MSIFDTEGFIPVASLCGVVDSQSWFIKCLIGKTGKILSVVYINEQCMYLSETHACTIIDCSIFLNVFHVTSTWPLILWWSDDDNISCTTFTERPSWNYLEVNCVPASVCISSKTHQPSYSTFPNLDWNMSRFSMTSLVVMFSIP